MFDVEIRRLTLAELARLSGAAEGVFEGDSDLDRIGRYVSTPGHVMIVAVNGSEVVGQVAAVLHHHPDRPVDLYIDDLAVGLLLPPSQPRAKASPGDDGRGCA